VSSSDDQVVLAHAVGIRQDLPVDLWIVMTAGAVVLVLSFVALGALWKHARLNGGVAGSPLPRPVAGLVDAPFFVWLLRLIALVSTAFVVFVAIAGPDEITFNLAPYALYVTFWVGLVPVSLLFGPVWRRVNPLRTVVQLLRPLTGPPPAEGGAAGFGVYPAAAFMLLFCWVELVYPNRAVPENVGVMILLYAVVQIIAALWWGEEWFEHGDAFEVWSTLLGRLAPIGRRDDGVLVLRSPLQGADGTAQVPGLWLFVVVMVGTTGFDGVTRAQWWQDHFLLSGKAQLVPTTGLLLTVALVAVLYVVATLLAGVIGRRVSGSERPTWQTLRSQPTRYAHSVIPIAAGYAIAHYFSLFFLEGQLTWILLSNPFNQSGVDLFGIYRHEVNLLLVTPRVISVVTVSAIVLGHVVGVVLAHDRAVRETRSVRAATLSQLPLLVMMVLFTLGGLALLLG
jgi:hypothetical protein